MKPTAYNRLRGIAFGMLLLAGPVVAQDDNDEPVAPEDLVPTVRLHYYGPNNAQRQLLLGFVGPPCTDDIDPGYDAINIFNLPNDAYFWVNGHEVFIQGVGAYSQDNTFTIGLKSEVDGQATLHLVETQNFPPDHPVYLYDNLTGTLHNLRTADLVVPVGVGTFNERFSMQFTSAVLSTLSLTTDRVSVRYHSADRAIQILNPTGIPVTKLALFSLDGREAAAWTDLQGDTTVPLHRFGSGVYVVNLATPAGNVRQKIVIH